MIKEIFTYSIIIFLFALESCTFGGEQNILTEKAVLINQLSILRNAAKTSLNLQLLFYDDQGDNRLNSFQLNSGNNSDVYTVTLDNNSKISFDRIEFYINTIAGSTSIREKTAPEDQPVSFHQADSGTTTTSSGSLKIFSTAQGYTNSNLFTVNGSDELGSYNISTPFILNSLPQGNLQQVIFHFNSILLSGNLQGPLKSKNFYISISANDVPFSRLCSVNLGFGQALNLNLDIQYLSFFKDTSTYSTIDNTKILRSIQDLSDSSPVITSTQNAGIYNEIVKNFNATSTLKEHKCNK